MRPTVPCAATARGCCSGRGWHRRSSDDPQLVFLDEPTSGLDPLGRLLVRDILRELRSRGVSGSLNFASAGEVEATCDRVAFVKQGRVVHELTLGEAPSFEVEIRAVPLDRPALEGLARFGTVAGRPSDDRVLLRVADDAVLPEVSAVAGGARRAALRAARAAEVARGVVRGRDG